MSGDNKLIFFHGSMASGKSLQLLVKAHNFDQKKIPILLIKPSIDNRDGTDIIKSRIGIERKCLPIDADTNLFSLAIKHRYCKYILVDECQFLTPQQVEQLATVVDRIGINVLCYGLRTDFLSKAFPGSLRLFELADEIIEIDSYCECGHKAIINARFDKDGNLVTDGEQIQIGGDDTYRAICRECFFNNLYKEKN